jgi:hypothetical protein
MGCAWLAAAAAAAHTHTHTHAHIWIYPREQSSGVKRKRDGRRDPVVS